MNVGALDRSFIRAACCRPNMDAIPHHGDRQMIDTAFGALSFDEYADYLAACEKQESATDYDFDLDE